MAKGPTTSNRLNSHVVPISELPLYMVYHDYDSRPHILLCSTRRMNHTHRQISKVNDCQSEWIAYGAVSWNQGQFLHESFTIEGMIVRLRWVDLDITLLPDSMPSLLPPGENFHIDIHIIIIIIIIIPEVHFNSNLPFQIVLMNLLRVQGMIQDGQPHPLDCRQSNFFNCRVNRVLRELSSQPPYTTSTTTTTTTTTNGVAPSTRNENQGLTVNQNLKLSLSTSIPMMIWTLGPMDIMLYMMACWEWTFEMGVWVVEMQLIKVLSMLVEVILLVRRRGPRNGKWYELSLAKDFQPKCCDETVPVSFCSLLWLPFLDYAHFTRIHAFISVFSTSFGRICVLVSIPHLFYLFFFRSFCFPSTRCSLNSFFSMIIACTGLGTSFVVFWDLISIIT